jgi:hypothetical protein
LEWIKARVGGVITSKKKRMQHHRDSYAWLVRQDRAIRFLNEIKSYLIVKKAQADLITERYKAVTHRAGKYTPTMMAAKIRLVNAIRKLNQRPIRPSITRQALTKSS